MMSILYKRSSINTLRLLHNRINHCQKCSLSLELSNRSCYTKIPPRISKTLEQQNIGLNVQYTQYRHKYDSKKIKNKRKEDEEEETDELADFDEGDGGRDNKLVKIKLTSMRTDLIIKSALNLARNKVEEAFYDSKIRVNGKKISKKSVSIKQGDEIDVIKDVSPINPEHIVVARIEILSVQPNENDISVVMRRFKSLTIENYGSSNAWKSGATNPNLA